MLLSFSAFADTLVSSENAVVEADLSFMETPQGSFICGLKEPEKTQEQILLDIAEKLKCSDLKSLDDHCECIAKNESEEPISIEQYNQFQAELGFLGAQTTSINEKILSDLSSTSSLMATYGEIPFPMKCLDDNEMDKFKQEARDKFKESMTNGKETALFREDFLDRAINIDGQGKMSEEARKADAIFLNDVANIIAKNQQETIIEESANLTAFGPTPQSTSPTYSLLSKSTDPLIVGQSKYFSMTSSIDDSVRASVLLKEMPSMDFSKYERSPLMRTYLQAGDYGKGQIANLMGMLATRSGLVELAKSQTSKDLPELMEAVKVGASRIGGLSSYLSGECNRIREEIKSASASHYDDGAFHDTMSEKNRELASRQGGALVLPYVDDYGKSTPEGNSDSITLGVMRILINNNLKDNFSSYDSDESKIFFEKKRFQMSQYICGSIQRYKRMDGMVKEAGVKGSLESLPEASRKFRSTQEKIDKLTSDKLALQGKRVRLKATKEDLEKRKSELEIGLEDLKTRLERLESGTPRRGRDVTSLKNRTLQMAEKLANVSQSLVTTNNELEALGMSEKAIETELAATVSEMDEIVKSVSLEPSQPEKERKTSSTSVSGGKGGVPSWMLTSNPIVSPAGNSVFVLDLLTRYQVQEYVTKDAGTGKESLMSTLVRKPPEQPRVISTCAVCVTDYNVSSVSTDYNVKRALINMDLEEKVDRFKDATSESGETNEDVSNTSSAIAGAVAATKTVENAALEAHKSERTARLARGIVETVDVLAKTEDESRPTDAEGKPTKQEIAERQGNEAKEREVFGKLEEVKEEVVAEVREDDAGTSTRPSGEEGRSTDAVVADREAEEFLENVAVVTDSHSDGPSWNHKDLLAQKEQGSVPGSLRDPERGRTERPADEIAVTTPAATMARTAAEAIGQRFGGYAQEGIHAVNLVTEDIKAITDKAKGDQAIREVNASGADNELEGIATSLTIGARGGQGSSVSMENKVADRAQEILRSRGFNMPSEVDTNTEGDSTSDLVSQYEVLKAQNKARRDKVKNMRMDNIISGREASVAENSTVSGYNNSNTSAADAKIRNLEAEIRERDRRESATQNKLDKMQRTIDTLANNEGQIGLGSGNPLKSKSQTSDSELEQLENNVREQLAQAKGTTAKAVAKAGSPKSSVKRKSGGGRSSRTPASVGGGGSSFSGSSGGGGSSSSGPAPASVDTIAPTISSIDQVKINNNNFDVTPIIEGIDDSLYVRMPSFEAPEGFLKLSETKKDKWLNQQFEEAKAIEAVLILPDGKKVLLKKK